MRRITIFEPAAPERDFIRPRGVTFDMPTLDQAKQVIGYVWHGRKCEAVMLGMATVEELTTIMEGARQNFERYRLSLSWNRWQGARLVLESRGAV